MASSTALRDVGIAAFTSTPFPVQRRSDEDFMASYATVHRLGMTMQRDYVDPDVDAG